MKIAIIGTGNIGGNLGQVWTAKGHEVVFGAREPISEWTRAAVDATGGKARIMPPAEAAAFGEVVVLAVPGNAVRDVAAGLGNVSGKIVIDTTNLLNGTVDAPSLAESIAVRAPGAKVVKAFNTMGAETLCSPAFNGVAATTFVCSDDGGAKQVVMRLAAEIGLDAVDAGPLTNAGSLEAAALLWIKLTRLHGREIGFRLLQR